MKNKHTALTPGQKSARRLEIMNTIAAKITKDPSMTWRRFETSLKRAYEQGCKISVEIRPWAKLAGYTSKEKEVVKKIVDFLKKHGDIFGAYEVYFAAPKTQQRTV